MIRFIIIALLISITSTFAQEEIQPRQELQIEKGPEQPIRIIDDFGFRNREFQKEIFEPRLPSRDVFDDFSPPENQVIKDATTDGNSFFGGATKQNEQEFRDARLKKISKLDFIERRVIQRSFSTFLRKNIENKMTASRKSMFKRLTAEVKNLRKAKNTRLAKNKSKNKVVYVYKDSQQPKK
ncbi:hypothetical protein [Candidatus Uabimicrobium sp. HlEnr_7]|uniref:hypothetical protein n=1 Tax=Candidatus Uabimicrobium helgolandensis TaxID=3095367 RepID=UPI0035590DD9